MEVKLILLHRAFTVNAFNHLFPLLTIAVHFDLHLRLHTQHLVWLAHAQTHQLRSQPLHVRGHHALSLVSPMQTAQWSEWTRERGGKLIDG